ncbi:DUF86 domain-containing protein [Candidatus Roizmanbacteria bacterium]|nr:DUF86 domain-containing protein [Candidatus Roizmanbacteria bacterium]
MRIEDRIAEISRRLRQLKESVLVVEKDAFLENHNLMAATERHIQVAIQACMDIASHIVAQMALEKPQRENKEIFNILADQSIIDTSLANRLVSMGGMRNVLVHNYLDVDDKKVYDAVKNDLKDIEAFVKQIQEFIDKQQNNKKIV